MTTNSAVAVCVKPVTLIKADQPAPCEGFLFTRAAELKNRTRLIEADFLEKELSLTKIKLDTQIEIQKSLEASLTAFETSNKQLSSDLKKEEDKGALNKFIYFGLGILTSILVFQAVR